MTALPSHHRTLPHGCTFPEEEWQILHRHWYPIAYTDEVRDKPLARTLLDEELIVYRTSGGQVVVARDLCIHRGVPLRFGTQEGDELICAYHGFRYGADGRCTRVPAQPDLPIPARLCLATFAAVERYGLIWTCLSAEPAGTIPDWPELADPAFRASHDAPPDWNATAGRQMENFLDVVHFAWIHAGTFGNREKPEIAPYEVERLPGGNLRASYPYLASNPAHSPLSGPDTPPTILRRMTYDVHLPFACRLAIDYGEGRTHCIFDIPTPVSLRKTRIFFFIARNFDLHVPERDLLDWENKILSEDRPIVEGQRPERLPLDLSEEFHIRGDRLSTAFRNALRGLGLGPRHAA
jgi:vanillate O-demethylase monooxygenase subunit